MLSSEIRRLLACDSFLFMCVSVSLTCSNAEAGIVVSAIETGGDVVMTYSGSLDLTGATFLTSGGGAQATVIPNLGFLSVGVGGHDTYALSAAINSYGPGGLTLADSFSGDLVQTGGTIDPRLYVPTGYSSGSSLSGSAVYNGHTFDSLGIVPGTYEWTIPNDFVRFQAQSAVVPEPSSSLLFLTLIAAGFARRSRSISV